MQILGNILTIDTENTTKNKGHPFTPSNKCCVISLAVDNDSPIVLKIEYDLEPYGDSLNTLQKFIELSDTIVGFNLKYDLHWLRRYGIVFSGKRIWDCQVAQFIIEHQLNPYPSLDSTAEFWKLGSKIDVVKNEYWDKGIDTCDIPYDILDTYARQDVNLTRDVYYKQQEYLSDKPKMRKLVTLDCLDLLVLEEMEWNGLVYDVDESLKLAKDLEDRAKDICDGLNKWIGVDGINWNSGDQLSAVLYGGTIKFTSKKLVPFTYKDGRVTQKLRSVVEEVTFPRLVEPLKKTELKKAGVFKTGADVLEELPAKGKVKEAIKWLLELADIEKQVGTYLKGIPKLIEEMEWENNTIHGNLNQCVAVTGRLSSNKPNLQNNPASIDLLFRSRYAD
jgi:DNA polymerase-1